MRIRAPFRLAVVATLATALSAGCGEEHAGSSISGQVLFQGKPLSQGTIEFSPAAGQTTMSGGEIKDGQYSIPPDKGLQPGAYDVRISSLEGGPGGPAPANEMPGEAPPPPKQLIPAQYNSKTTLKAEVKESGENKFDFTIP
jgi:hypothetical protein